MVRDRRPHRPESHSHQHGDAPLFPETFDRHRLEQALETVYAAMPPTPQYAWPLLERRLGLEVWIKHENHTPVGAFKVRGGLVLMETWSAEGRGARGIITATRGNHGQSIPFAARRYGIPVTVVVPETNASEKNRAMEALGARLIVHGDDFEASRQHASRLAESESLEFLGPFHPELVHGVATYAHELLRHVSEIDTVYVPIGMGSGICGTIGVRDLLGLSTEVVGVVAEGAPAYARSLEAGRVVTTDRARTFADGIACRAPSAEAFEVIRRGAARIVAVSDQEIAEAIRILFQDTHNVAEGAGAAALAGLIRDRRQHPATRDQRRVAVILCGGNVDSTVFAQVLNGRTPEPN